MARTKRNNPTQSSGTAKWRAALYARLSREDGDKLESDSIGHQKKLLEVFVAGQPDMEYSALYCDDGYTGTNFQRPNFQQMLTDLAAGRVNCVIVKDLSRFGRDYIDVGRYLERWFPEHGVRFIALGDNIDSENGPYDMLLPVKNVINEQYARDISQKVRSSVRMKQQQGEFIGAFASYGYRKDPENHNKLLIDPPAAEVVRRIFTMFEQGVGKIKIAKTLNTSARAVGQVLGRNPIWLIVPFFVTAIFAQLLLVLRALKDNAKDHKVSFLLVVAVFFAVFMLTLLFGYLFTKAGVNASVKSMYSSYSSYFGY